MGLPLVVRPAYTLGGTGGGVATTREELERVVSGGLAASPVRQVLLERYLAGWKEIEYEVIRDGAGNCITVSNMENFDPMGVHTAASIAVGKHLDQIINQVTGKSTAAFEPALDYCVVKIPRWPFDKFATGDRVIGTQMKATGEVMAIGRSFEAALQKAVRSLEVGGKSLLWEDPSWRLKDNLEPAEVLDRIPLGPTDLRLWGLMAALRRGVSEQDLALRTGIDLWFFSKLKVLVQMERRLLAEPLTR